MVACTDRAGRDLEDVVAVVVAAESPLSAGAGVDSPRGPGRSAAGASEGAEEKRPRPPARPRRPPALRVPPSASNLLPYGVERMVNTEERELERGTLAGP